MNKNNKIKNLIWHSIVIVLSVASLIEVCIGFLPISNEKEEIVKIFFMGLTLIGFFYEIISYMFSDFSKKTI